MGKCMKHNKENPVTNKNNTSPSLFTRASHTNLSARERTRTELNVDSAGWTHDFMRLVTAVAATSVGHCAYHAIIALMASGSEELYSMGRKTHKYWNIRE